MDDEHRGRRKRKPAFVVMGSVLLAAASYFGYAIASSHIAQSRVAETFLPVQAVVVSSDVSSHSSGASTRSYGVEIKYRYAVGGMEYQSHRYAYTSNGFKDYDDARNMADRYPTGARFTAYHDPLQPADAVIYRAPPGVPLAVMSFPFALFELIGLLMLVHGLRGTRRTESLRPASP